MALLSLEGRDEELKKLMGGKDLLDKLPEGSPHSAPLESIRGNVCNGKGVGRDLIEAIMTTNGASPGERVIREAMATLKSSKEHDRIIAAAAAEVEERVEMKRKAAI